MNTNRYEVRNGEIYIDTIIKMIKQNKRILTGNAAESEIFIDLPDERCIKCSYHCDVTGWTITMQLLRSDKDSTMVGIVPMEMTVPSTTSLYREDPIQVRKRTMIDSLQSFLLDNKYKIAVI